MKLLFMIVAISFSASAMQAQSLAFSQMAEQSQNGETVQSAINVLSSYAKWRADILGNYPQGLLTPHYAVAIAVERLNDSTAQVEVLIAAEMKQYTVSIKPVTLNRLASGETESKPAGNAVTIDQKAGEKLGTGSDKIRIGQATTTVAVGKAVQALEITWTPKNESKEGFANTCIVQLSKEPTVMVNGYVLGQPIR